MKHVYKLCPAALYSVVQSHCSILSHDALQHCLSSNSSLENGERELGHLFRYCFPLSALGERAYSATGKFKSALFDIWLRHPANCIPVGHGSSPDPSLLLRKWVGPARLHYIKSGVSRHFLVKGWV